MPALTCSHFFSAEHHFDAESFSAGQLLILSDSQNIISALNNNNAGGARTALGQALHTIQDFYSHSDWVELGNTTPNPNLGRTGKTITNVSPLTETTCV